MTSHCTYAPRRVLMGETLHRTRASCQKATRVLENVWPLTHRTLLVCFDENHWARFLGIKLKSSVTIRPSQPHLSLYSLPLHTSLSQTHAQCSFQNSANKCLYLISSFSSCGLLNNSSCLWLWRELYKPRMRCLKGKAKWEQQCLWTSPRSLDGACLLITQCPLPTLPSQSLFPSDSYKGFLGLSTCFTDSSSSIHHYIHSSGRRRGKEKEKTG